MKFEQPTMKRISFDVKDVLTASGGDDWELPIVTDETTPPPTDWETPILDIP